MTVQQTEIKNIYTYSEYIRFLLVSLYMLKLALWHSSCEQQIEIFVLMPFLYNRAVERIARSPGLYFPSYEITPLLTFGTKFTQKEN